MANPLVVDHYLSCLKRAGIEPNFFQSHEYLTHKDLDWVEGPTPGLGGFVEPEEFCWFICPLRDDVPALDCPCWAGQPEEERPEPSFLVDQQIIYDPKNFLDLSGGDWVVFRRNIRKWTSRHKGLVTYDPLEEGTEVDASANLLEKWAHGRELEDVETLLRFAMFGKNRWALRLDGELVGLNVADENYQYINYRLAVDRGDPFLQEYLRYLFYTSLWVIGRDKLVNDGGCLGSAGLLRFKMKLRPVKVSFIYGGDS